MIEVIVEVDPPSTPLLDRIRGPEDLRWFDARDLTRLASEIRRLIIATVNRNGGHLGSNLGIVELTIALHRVFESPHDVILFDTGHQTYPHKLLTGRREAFDSLRSPGGMSGYPSRVESSHDWIENSHASTALAYAHGLATAVKAREEDRQVVAVIGDGSLTGGMALEGLNNLGHSSSDVTIILNDNGRSYAPTISKLSESLIKLRASPVYMRRQERIEQIAESVPWVGDMLRRGIDATKMAIRHMWDPPFIFEQLGIHYVGPYNGHEIAELEKVLEKVKLFEGPTVVHVITQKGRGYKPAERDPIKNMHDLSSIKQGSYTAAFAEHMVRMGERHPELVAVTAAMPDSTGLLPFVDRFPDRAFDVGIAEQHAVTMASGMAMGGMRPIVAIYSTFLTRALDQINLDTALHRCPVVFCIDRAGITGDDGASHHGTLDMVLLSKIPGMTIFAPSSYEELPVMLDTALETTYGPCAIRWPKTAAPKVSPDQVGSGLSARRAREGSDVCLIGIGKMLATASEAADRLESEGISCSVWDPRVVKPLDPVMISDAIGHRLVVTVEDGLREGGIGQAIRDQISASAPTPVVVLGIPTVHIPHGRVDQILSDYGLDASGIVANAKKHL
ncbi:MAG: 1-deoxy-D-xylulose-5-phosphate synthase [bacterium]|nr:1-deoxy-D-xylulose-5-phosphate synthase [bacterium]MDE0287969.1 1-deoxy-D-xylulose-5-phosphate synthase [bacterium]MDE0438093.1 1-deoxy-D-xylulose-5-phosphate synthase [bacterium]